jgi:threonine aldolase
MYCSRKFIERVRRKRKMLSDGMKQAGVIAGPGLIALRKMRHLINEDNRVARLFDEKLFKISYVELVDKV